MIYKKWLEQEEEETTISPFRLLSLFFLIS